MRKRAFTLLFLSCCTLAAMAQPVNDDCTAPFNITDVTNYCSPVGAYTNVGATPSTYGPPQCWTATQNDVWFTFTAQYTDVTITVRGATANAPGGTLQNPQISLYLGTCGGTINQLECQSAPPGAHIVEAYQGGLYPGSTYFIRIQGLGGATGTFQLCLNNYNPPVDPTSDCPTAAILCDKSPFVVQQIIGAGNNITELDDAQCFFNGAPSNFESNSTWFTWTCETSGTLTFTLSPLNVTDDLDFVLYRLPNGIGNCQGKEVVRCMASGTDPTLYPNPCMGPTGLLAGETDVSEDAGCTDVGDNAWIAPLDMVAGESYALCVNNFSSTGNGFSIEFGGSGTFLGPKAAFTTIPEAVCLGTPVTITDNSTFALGAITGWKWSFGANAQPLTANGAGPHTVTFNTPGTQPVVLTLETDLGCQVTDIQSVTVYPDVKVDTIFAAPDCNGATNGAITINNIESGTPPYLFSWNGGPFTSDNSLENLGVGNYTLVIRDANNCETSFDIPLEERILTADVLVDKPLCFGDDNGVITLIVTNGKPPVEFDWGNGYIPDNTEDGFAAGTYTVKAIDVTLCEGTFEVTVEDNPPLALALDTINISCYGLDDGSATANPSGGVGNYSYLWSDGQQSQTAVNFPPGPYTVTVTDGNDCTITGDVLITEPPDLLVDLIDVVNLLCNGIPEGEIRLEGSGGRPPYTFSADGITYAPTDTLTGLAAGTYWAKIQDASGCVDSVQATLTQPPPLIVIAEPADTTLDLGFQVFVSTFTAPIGRPVTYEWTPGLGLDCTDCPEPYLTAIQDQLYVIKITDETGCMALDTVRVKVRKDRPIYAPNAFAPDNPGLNDHFTLFGGPAAERILLLRVYDRWGSLIFEGKDLDLGELNQGWDGTYRGDPVNNGVFTWYALVRFVDHVEVPYEGDVTVIR
ncbi:MAG: gliding motility-associated C-terminal domain-containing protein [Saprospiraceae bacterium]|nr:gliding motility-associated C-terminal domain-containing protein [Saprospiraceae bacterium]